MIGRYTPILVERHNATHLEIAYRTDTIEDDIVWLMDMQTGDLWETENATYDMSKTESELIWIRYHNSNIYLRVITKVEDHNRKQEPLNTALNLIEEELRNLY